MSGERFVQAAYAYLYIGDYEQARAAFERAVSTDPLNPKHYYYASITAHRSGHYEEALTLVHKAIDLCPTNELYKSYLATIRASQIVEQGIHAYVLGDTEKAFEAFLTALQMDPLHEEAQVQFDKLLTAHPSYWQRLEEENCDRRESD